MGKYKKLISNTVVLGIGTFSSKLFVFLMMPFYTRWLMPAEFSAAEYGKRAKLHGYAIYSALKLLEAVGLVEKGEKKGRSYIYRLLPKEK